MHIKNLAATNLSSIFAMYVNLIENRAASAQRRRPGSGACAACQASDNNRGQRCRKVAFRSMAPTSAQHRRLRGVGPEGSLHCRRRGRQPYRPPLSRNDLALYDTRRPRHRIRADAGRHARRRGLSSLRRSLRRRRRFQAASSGATCRAVGADFPRQPRPRRKRAASHQPAQRRRLL